MSLRLPSESGPVRQLSLFGTEAADPSPADLAGLLAGPAEIVRMGGTARLSIVVDPAWRVHVLVAELTRRGLRAAWEATADGRHRVRTSYTSALTPLAAAWLSDAPTKPTTPPPASPPPTGSPLASPPPTGSPLASPPPTGSPLASPPPASPPPTGPPLASPPPGDSPPASSAPVGSSPAAGVDPAEGAVRKCPPAAFHLNGRRLRLWLAAAGVAEPAGFRLYLGRTDQPCWEPVGRALAAVGLTATLLDAEEGGPAYRITGRRRLARLAELVGDRPSTAPPDHWPAPGTVR